MDAQLDRAYAHWKKKYLVRVPAKKPTYRVAFGKPGTTNHKFTVSEGQGYGMLIVTAMADRDPNARKYAAGLYRFAYRHPSTIDGRLMSWKVGGKLKPSDSAFDGDSDIAYGLVQAAKRWGNSKAWNFPRAARRVLRGVMASTIGPDSHLPMLGDWVDAAGSDFNQWTVRTSDVMPANFAAFARFTGDSRWNTVSDASLAVIDSLQASHLDTGLVPDFAAVDPATGVATPESADFLEGPNDGAYYYNAGRVPLRLAMDAVVNCSAFEADRTGVLANWAIGATGGDPFQVKAGYALDGTPLPGSDYYTSFFASPLVAAGLFGSGSSAWLTTGWRDIRNLNEDYYSDSVTFLSMLVISGHWRDRTAPR